jgi:hypothetical protein
VRESAGVRWVDIEKKGRRGKAKKGVRREEGKR